MDSVRVSTVLCATNFIKTYADPLGEESIWQPLPSDTKESTRGFYNFTQLPIARALPLSTSDGAISVFEEAWDFSMAIIHQML
jgi:hypothetical protein